MGRGGKKKKSLKKHKKQKAAGEGQPKDAFEEAEVISAPPLYKESDEKPSRRQARLLQMPLEARVANLDPLVSGEVASYQSLFVLSEREEANRLILQRIEKNPRDETLWRFLPYEKKRKKMMERAIENLRSAGFYLPPTQDLIEAIGDRDSASIHMPPVLEAIIEQGTQVSPPGIVRAEWYERSYLRKNTFSHDKEKDLWDGQGFPARSHSLRPKRLGWSWAMAASGASDRGSLKFPFLLSKPWRVGSSTDGTSITKGSARRQLDRVIDKVVRQRMRRIIERQREWEAKNGPIDWDEMI